MSEMDIGFASIGAIVLVLLSARAALLAWARRIPACTCNAPDCGGGCIRR